MKDVYTMVVPQWQGAAAGTGPYHGAQAIVRLLGEQAIDAFVEVREQSVAKKEEGVWYRRDIAEHFVRAADRLNEANPKKVFTIGGDCASDVVAISYLNKHYDGEMTLLWLDAHADLNTPETSPSNKFHGMPLRLLLGEGAPSLLQMLPSTILPQQVLYTGLRELDHGERQYIVDHGIPNIPMCHECADMLEAVVAKRKKGNLYLHIDLDVIDPMDFDSVACPSPGGFWFEDLLDSIRELASRYHIVGCAITEYQPKNDDDEQKVGRLLEVVADCMG